MKPFMIFCLCLLLTLSHECVATTHVFIYGDSNTWGMKSTPRGAPIQRYADNERWGGVLQTLLGNDYEVTVNGLIGRTLNADFSEGLGQLQGEDHNGTKRLPLALFTAAPVDIVIVMLGTNDLLDELQRQPADIANDIKKLASIVQAETVLNRQPPRLLMIAPPPLADTSQSKFKDSFGAIAVTKSHQLAKEYLRIAKENNINLLNAGDYIQTDADDAVHLSVIMHQRLAKAVAERIKTMAK